MKKSLACAVVAIGLVLGGGGAAMAGETTGNGNETPIAGHDTAASICAFSGQDVDDSVENNPVPEADDDAVTERGQFGKGNQDEYRRVQNWGAYAKHGLNDELTAAGQHPGQSCRGNLSPMGE